ncbi:SNF2 helicase associated domain-containing protein [Allocoprobacillus halotolerans]|uniref:SNF2 helicase associated domain-containing protein n=1 Tax=Allocoprobacillus halotolerans TaxID=2944914 RepID=A0ABY5I3M3_9FIRM|nr:SNF2 helicase associated domain-containing protein [Allocoprobacillus halotolerans]UTY39333.1 SNF2 helicase associated domain-containing protein [Allocoprobacillus halotolerans]
MIKKYQIPLEISLKEENYILDLADYREFEHVFMSPQYIYSFNNDILYRYDFHAPMQVLTFIQKWMQTKGGFYIPQESLMDFYKYVLYDMNDDIVLNTHLFDSYHQEDMINLYADMTKDDQICVQLEYIYDDHICYGFDEKNTHKSKKADLIEDYLRPYIEDIDENMLYLKYDHEFSYQFLKESLPYLSHYCQIFVSDTLNSFSTSSPVDIQVGVHLQHGLLSIDIHSVHVQKEELIDLLKAYKKKESFIN